ncbi:hypothetical protein CEXT_393661, partial [Caerostris extrusa]
HSILPQTFPLLVALLQVPEQKEEKYPMFSPPTPSSINSSQTFPLKHCFKCQNRKKKSNVLFPTLGSINYSQTFITPEALLQVLKQKVLLVEEVTTERHSPKMLLEI